MSQYEYTIIQMAAGGRITHLNERLEAMVAEGWEPMTISGDATVSVLLRRPKAAGGPQTAAQPSPAAAPRPSA